MSHEIAGESSEEDISTFRREVRERMLRDHPHLTERYLPRLNSEDYYDRKFLAGALHAIMDVIDLRAKAQAVHETQHEHTDVA